MSDAMPLIKIPPLPPVARCNTRRQRSNLRWKHWRRDIDRHDTKGRSKPVWIAPLAHSSSLKGGSAGGRNMSTDSAAFHDYWRTNKPLVWAHKARLPGSFKASRRGSNHSFCMANVNRGNTDDLSSCVIAVAAIGKFIFPIRQTDRG